MEIVMNKKVLAAIIVLLLAGMGWLAYSLMQEKQANKDMEELAALDKQEMEKEYQDFALQYDEMKTYIKNDSIIAQLTEEQERTQKLLEELKKTHTKDVAEITRLKKELATVRAVLRSYVIQIDSLNRLNQTRTTACARSWQRATSRTSSWSRSALRCLRKSLLRRSWTLPTSV